MEGAPAASVTSLVLLAFSLVLLAFIALSLPVLAGAQQTCQPDGDVDQNGSVTAADALLVFQQALNLASLSVCQQTIADVSPQPAMPDGNITAADALCIFQRALSLPSCFDSVPPSNQLPVANAGPDRSVDAGTMVILSATASDPDGTIDGYAWEQMGGTTIILAGADTATAIFIAPDVSADETLTFRIIVTDDDDATSSASIFDHGIEMMQLDPFRQFGPFFFTQTDHIELLHNHPSQLMASSLLGGNLSCLCITLNSY